jgi:hypothetical protein
MTRRSDPLAGRLLVDLEGAAALCGVTPAEFRAWVDAGLAPCAAHVGRRALWPVPVLRQWAGAYCPDFTTFCALADSRGWWGDEEA